MTIKKIIETSIAIKKAILSDDEIISTIELIAESVTTTFKSGGKLLFCGNGGSAADAQHLAAEFSGRYQFDRSPLFAEALNVNSSYITAVANDYSFDIVYSRLVKAFGKKNDILFAISTSGNSKNIINAIDEANNIGMITIGFTGNDGGKMNGLCKYIIKVPSIETPRIQECHIMIGHIICELVENNLFGKKP
jgi:D-sedoheptulose 7-phosphate isomerase